MILTQADIDELITVYFKETGELLTESEAREMGERLLRTLDHLTSPPKTPRSS